MFLLGLPTLESLRTSSLERHVAAADVGHVQSNALVQLSLGESGGDYSDARAAIVDEGTHNRVGGKECGTYLIVSMERSASTTLCHDVNLIDGPKSQCAFELLGLTYSQKHNHNQDWVREHPREFVRQRANEFRALRDVCVWGFKLFDRQLADVSQIISEVDKCIIYRRENTTAQYLSWKTAVTYDCWATDPRKQAADPDCAKRVTELGDDWPQFQTRVDKWYAKSEASCRAAGRPVTFLSMEDYLAPQWQTYEQEVAKLARSDAIAKRPV